MGIYEGIKDVAKVVQQADNVDLYKKLLDLSAQALDMQAELTRLKTENEELRKQQDLDKRIVRHKSPYITLSGESNDICYCPHQDLQFPHHRLFFPSPSSSRTQYVTTSTVVSSVFLSLKNTGISGILLVLCC